MQSSLIVGAGLIRLRIRHAESLKDKRKVVQSLISRLKNLGFSTAQTETPDDPKYAAIGLAVAGNNYGVVDRGFELAEKLLIGEFEVLAFERSVFDYTSESEATDFADDP